MPLPTTFSDAIREDMVLRAVEAIHAIKDLIPTNPEKLIRQLVEMLGSGLADRQELVRSAEHGDLLAHEAIERFHNALLEHGISSGATITAYIIDKRRHPERARGRDWWANFSRDLAIVLIVELTCQQYGISATRSVGTSRKTPCGAETAAKAFTRCGYAIGEKAVANLCGRRQFAWGSLRGLSLLEQARKEIACVQVKNLLSL
jgi:hypothetical protein